MNINLNIRNEKKIREQLIECTYKITHILAAIYPRFHTHLLVPKLKSRRSFIIVLFDT